LIKYIFYISIGILFLFPQILFAQKQFQTVFGGNNEEQSRKVLQTENNDYLVLGMTTSYGSGDKDISITRIDTNGIIIWTKILGTSIRDAPYDLKTNPTGGYMIAAWVLNDPPSYDDWYIIKIDENGNILSETFFGGNHDDEIMDMELTLNGEYLLAGSTWSFANSLVDICIARMDQNLNLLWIKTFGTGIREYSRSVKRCNDGSFIIIGGQKDYNDQNNRIIVLKIDENGNLVWSKKYSGSNEDWGFDIIETINGDCLAVGYTNSYGVGNYDILVNKIDTDGNLLWAKTYGGSNDDKAFKIKKVNNGSYFISGYTNSFGAGDYDVLLLNINDDGNVIGAFTFGGESDEGGRSFLEKTNDGGCIIASQTKSFGNGNYDNFIIKTDENGNSCCGAEITNMIVNTVSPEVNLINFTIGSGEEYPNHNIITDEIDFPYEYICIDDLEIIGEDTVCAFATNIEYSINPNILIDLIWILPAGASISQNFSDTTIYVNFGNTSGYIYLQSNGCDDSILDSLYINISEITPPELGNDTTICSNEPALLNPGSGYINYFWQDGSTDSTYLVDTTGLYWVEVTNEYGCSAIDSIFIELLPSPEINLGNDTLICAGDSLILNAGSGFSTYLWSTGSADSVIVIDTSGVFWVIVTNEFGCSSIDSIFVDYYPFAFEDLELGNDTSFCYGDAFVLSASSGYTYYEWQNGSHDSIFIADTAGVYWVYVSNPCGEAWDTINLSLYPITEINLGNDTAVCFGEFILLDPGADFISYLWHNGSINQFIYAGQTGTYWVQVTDSNYCMVTDSVNLEFILPDPDIGNDTTICFGDTITFFALDEFVSYLWQDGSVGLSFTADTSGIFWCEVTDTMGCMGVDSVCLNLIYPPSISLGNDTSICTGDSVWLSFELSGGDYEILWQDGSSDSAFITSESGIYWVQVSNICGIDTDSVYVTLLPLPEIFLGNDTIIGVMDDILLDADSGFESYLWNDGSTGQTLMVSDSGYYWVNVFDGSCKNSDTIFIEPVKCDMFIPIVFTPNNDGFNDYFFAVVSDDISDFSLMVFNRWGEKIWETDDLYDKWDGKRNGRPAAEGTYYWITKYKCLGSPQEFEKRGSVTLLR